MTNRTYIKGAVLVLIALMLAALSLSGCPEPKPDGTTPGGGSDTTKGGGGKTLVSIAVTPPTKNRYIIGETLNTGGMVVTATYSDSKTAAVTGYTTSGFDSTTTGQKTVTVSYEGKTATFTVTVINPQLPTVATPAASPPAGTYTAEQSVTLSSTTTGAAIYYTTNGTDPTTSSALYSGAISIRVTTTLKAFAVKDGMNNSMVLTAVYNISGGTFTSIDELGTWLSSQPVNSAATAYNVKLTVNNLGGDYNTAGSLGYVIRNNNTKYVNLDLSGNTFTSIGKNSFAYCTSLTSVTIGSDVSSIGDGAFSECTNLKSVTIGSGVTSIGGLAFGGCTNLTSINIPGIVTKIEDGAFYYCTRLTSVTFVTGSNIPDANFGNNSFPEGEYGYGGDTLKNAYSTGKEGTYKRPVNGTTWTKQ